MPRLLPETLTRRVSLTLLFGAIGLMWTLLTSLVAEEEQPAEQQPQKLPSAQVEFFETHIRPVLVDRCYVCHESGNAEGGLQLDYRQAVQKGGDSGALFNFKEPAQSLLVKVLKHEVEGLEMPQGEDQLDDETIAHFVSWIKMGAPDPREAPTGAASPVSPWENTFKERQQWWSFQPVTAPVVPELNGAVSDHPIDRFIQQKLEEQDLAAASPADQRTLIRRLSLVLTGLPPTPEEIDYFLADESPDAYERLVDGYLNSKRFGERWARHWMDWVRYTDTHGSEGDPPIPYAYRYRDYLIRAINADIPYDQLVREHIAGDLLPDPRTNAELGINESAIGTAHWRMVFHGFAPTDALEEKVRFTDDQINVYSKAFLGLTVSCARCHNHKFDAISQADFYALYGILDSTRPATIDINTPEFQQHYQPELTKLKSELKTELVTLWQSEVESIAERLETLDLSTINTNDRRELLHVWKQLAPHTDKTDFDTAWNIVEVGYRSEQNHIQRHEDRDYYRRWKFADTGDYHAWHRDGNGLAAHPSPPGEFAVTSAGEKIITGIQPAGVYSNRLSEKHRGVLSSPRFHLDQKYDIYFRTVGDQNALNRYAVQHYPRSGTVYPVHRMNKGEWHWSKFAVDYWTGDDIHLEVTTAEDQPILTTGNERSWFGLREVVVVEQGTEAPPAYDLEYLQPIFAALNGQPLNSSADVARAIQTAAESAVTSWQEDKLTDAQAFFLDHLLDAKLLSNTPQNERLKQLLTEYRDLEQQVPTPTRVPGLLETDVVNQPLMVRGNHKQLNEEVPRRFLDAVDASPYDDNDSGRLELAEDTVRADNPFTSRVIVNRLWHYVFGAGLVRTPDNFGQLGEQPTHPELLDFLATRFVNDGWSMKKMIRLMVTSDTFKRAATPSEMALELDPENHFWSHAMLRRLEAEAIRDTILAVSGQLDLSMFGPGYKPNQSETKRSVYGLIKRNDLDSFLATFDAPTPFATKGNRDVTNVPGQSLTMLNDPFVIESAKKWIRMIEEEYPDLPAEKRIDLMFEQALGRPPTDLEKTRSLSFLNAIQSDYQSQRTEFARLDAEQTELEQQVEAIFAPIRERLVPGESFGADDLPQPVALWKFDENPHDEISGLEGTLQGSARIEDGALVLDGKGYVSTETITERSRARTFEVWVQLANLEQQGGGAITLQRQDGILFDSIVIGEIKPRHWLAGSNNHHRSLPFGGEEETVALTEPVHIALTYEEDGTIRAYRNGAPYGQPIQKGPLMPYAADESNFLFGLRHSPAAGNRYLQGRIYEARFYDRVLSPSEIEVSSRSLGQYISPAKLRAELTEEQRPEVEQLEGRIQEIRAARKALGNEPAEAQAWIDLGHAIFNLKNFIYYE
ncbi:MAG: hypothetical protein CMJ46_01710 [Planctomyces sp.]|nr:hypothetical protein [Planctomyces sp.]